MNRLQFKMVSAMVSDKAASMWQYVMAKCPDDHLQDHIAEARAIAREKGFVFNRVVWADDHYGFFNDEEPVAVIVSSASCFDIYSNEEKATDTHQLITQSWVRNAA